MADMKYTIGNIIFNTPSKNPDYVPESSYIGLGLHEKFLKEANNKIEAQEAEIKRLRVALENILYHENERVEDELKKQVNGMPLVNITIKRIAQSALKGDK